MAAAELIDGRTGEVTPVSMLEGAIALNLPDDLRIEDWQALGRRLCTMEQRVSWWLGDWWAFGDHHYGARAKMVAEGVFGASCGHLRNMAVVARRFEPSCRHDKLSFTHHQEVASLPSDVALAVLSAAAAHGWSARETRIEVLRRRLEAELPPAARPSPAAIDGVFDTDHIIKRTTRIVIAAFIDWFGIGEEYAKVLLALYRAGGELQDWRLISRAVSTHSPMARGAVHEAISSLRSAFECEAIDTDEAGYSLTEVGFAECRRAFRELGQQLLSMGLEPANDLSPLSGPAVA